MTKPALPRGYRTVRALITPADRRALREEARLLRARAQRRVRESFALVDGWQLLGPVRNWIATDGDNRAKVHHRMLDGFSDLVQPGLHPTLSCYLYYDPGDFVGLHQDQEQCHYDVLVVLDGEAGPLCVHPELADKSPMELWTAATTGIRTPGTPVPLGDGPLVLAGRATPHHRPPHSGPGRLTLAAFCFGPAQQVRPR